jgi:transcriptional regulator with XRE-family HTH domain
MTGNVHWAYDAMRIRTAREARDITQQQLADMIGATKQQVSAWEQGSSGITSLSLIKICNALQCPPKFFFTVNADGADQGKE